MPEELKTTEELITAAMADAQIPIGDEPVEMVDPDDEPEVVAEAAKEPAKVEEKEAVVEGEKKGDPLDADDDPELTKLLEEYGIKRAGKVQNDNRLSYSRIRKITGKIVKTIHAKNKADLDERDSKYKTLEDKLKPYEVTDALIQSDPDRYVGILAAIHPDKYKKFLTPAEVKEVKAAVKVTEDPIPGPDQKFSDGTVGYSPEQMEKRENWLVAKAKTDAVAEMETRFKPILDAHQAKEVHNQMEPGIRAQLNRLKETWGELFVEEYKKDKDSDIIKLMRQMDAQGTPITMDAAATQILLPRKLAAEKAGLTPDREKMRAEILAEIEKAPAAAQRTTPGQTKQIQNVESMTTEEIIRSAMLANGLK